MTARALARSMVLGLWALAASCDKVPIVDINAAFTIADVSWFDDERTMFVFYRVDAEQGLGPESLIELRYRTDDVFVDWTPLEQLPAVHTHLPADCGPRTKCGSWSIAVDQVPRDVALRLRYHRSGVLSLNADVALNVVGPGPAHLVRSLAVYGVFDETNTRVQWRARHQFPTIRNEQATALGLRRQFTISDVGYGQLGPVPADNLYGYAVSPVCSAGFVPLPWETKRTTDRAFFEPLALPLAASDSDLVCAAATVTDALGEVTFAAIARKNPQTKPAFPLLRSPIRDLEPVGVILRPCNRVINDAHLAMQVQRLQLEGAPTLCIDDFASAGFVNRLVGELKTRIDRLRTAGKDLVLVVALHRDDTTVVINRALENVLLQVVLPERDKSTPRLIGAFVFDSASSRLTSDTLKSLVLWCPSRLVTQTDLDFVPGASERDCPLLPDAPPINLGPFSFTQLPILPTRQQYETFVAKYSEANTGRVTALSFRGPQRSAVSENIPLGEVGVITKFNNERISAAPTDAFSFCQPGEEARAQSVARAVVQAVDMPGAITQLQGLPQLHQQSPSTLYALGLAWESPFIVKMDYETRLAGAASVVSVTIPFGIVSTAERFLGSEQWKQETFPLADALTQCTRWCDHPTFDSAGVYQPTAPFRLAFAQQCYAPRFPVPPGGGFPDDP
ncbi:MAG: hypothetical protein SFW67_09005 [Myxococcaceae bacterium]|nr:hypothetical protein [Myxococcaceae bacterium]